MSNSSDSNPFSRLLYIIACVCTAMIGYTIHKNIFWSIVDFFLTPLVWIKWLICKDVTLEIIKKTFDWFL